MSDFSHTSAELLTSPALRLQSARGSVLLSTSSDRVYKPASRTRVTGYPMDVRHPSTTEMKLAGTAEELSAHLLFIKYLVLQTSAPLLVKEELGGQTGGRNNWNSYNYCRTYGITFC